MNASATLTILSLLVAAPLFADSPARRGEGERGRRPAVTRPALPALPEALDVRVDVTRRDAARRSVEVPYAVRVDRAATKAARWSADEWLRTVGWREHFRAGVHRGLRVALDDPTLGEWDRYQGLQTGLDDPEAHDLGAGLGRDAARERAAVDAEARVERQFTDLSWQPRFEPAVVTPRPGVAPSYLDEPRLRDVFRDVPAPRAVERALDGFGHDRWALYGMATFDGFYDAGWAEPARGFDFWCVDATRTAGYLRLTPPEQQRFRATFLAVFEERIAERRPRVARRAFRAGFADGWDHGAELAYEWAFRRGYHQGYNEALDASLDASFATHYPRLFERRYRAAFDDWSENPKLAILSMTLADDSDDGIFEPGEQLWVDYELVNYGGRGGTLPLRLAGDLLDRDVTQDVVVPARDTLRSSRAVPAILDRDARPNTQAALELSVLDASRTAPLTVSYPLALDGFVVERIDAVGGDATVAIRVANRSTARAEGLLTLARDDRGATQQASLSLEPRGVRELRFALQDVDPIALLAGELDLRGELGREDRPYEDRAYRLPNLSRDLASDQLLRVMLAASGGELALSRDEQAALRGLMLDRLRVDWRASVRQRGNPYKRDYRKGTTTTALGALVEATDVPSVEESPLFAGLRGDVLELAGDLPGAHPFLRKYTRRLARKLP